MNQTKQPETHHFWLALVEVFFLRGETPGAHRAQFTVRSLDNRIPAKCLHETQLRGIQMAVQVITEVGDETPVTITDAAIINMIPLGYMTQDEFNAGMEEPEEAAKPKPKKPAKKGTVVPMKPRVN